MIGRGSRFSHPPNQPLPLPSGDDRRYGAGPMNTQTPQFTAPEERERLEQAQKAQQVS